MLGPIGLGYDRTSDKLVVQLEELVPVDDDGEPITTEQGHVRLYVTRSQANAFCDHAEQSSPPAGRAANGAPSRSIPTVIRARA